MALLSESYQECTKGLLNIIQLLKNVKVTSDITGILLKCQGDI
jgi:hypothetical protein